MSKYQIMPELTMVYLSDVSGNFCDESVAKENVSHAAVHLQFGHIQFHRCMQTENPSYVPPPPSKYYSCGVLCYSGNNSGLRLLCSFLF